VVVKRLGKAPLMLLTNQDFKPDAKTVIGIKEERTTQLSFPFDWLWA
jgi:hypothetical protein